MAGGEVMVAPRVCCGRALISKGFLDAARPQAEACVLALLPLAQAGTPILFCEPSCCSAVVDDYLHLLRGEARRQAERVAAQCLSFEERAAGALLFPRDEQRGMRDEKESSFPHPSSLVPHPCRPLLAG